MQTLERLLRQPATRTTVDTKKNVLERILDKIDWRDRDAVDGESFLNEYYAALRAHLEQRAVLGDRRADKHEAASQRSRRMPRE